MYSNSFFTAVIFFLYFRGRKCNISPEKRWGRKHGHNFVHKIEISTMVTNPGTKKRHKWGKKQEVFFVT